MSEVKIRMVDVQFQNNNVSFNNPLRYNKFIGISYVKFEDSKLLFSNAPIRRYNIMCLFEEETDHKNIQKFTIHQNCKIGSLNNFQHYDEQYNYYELMDNYVLEVKTTIHPALTKKDIDDLDDSKSVNTVD